ncbi:MAG: carbohydrate ABC transporter permease [Spirochaetaceae bacterium]
MKKKLVRESAGERTFNILNAILCILITLIVLYPLYYIIIAAVSKPYALISGELTIFPVGFNLESFKKALAIDGLWVAYGNTFYYTFVGTLVNMFFTTTGAYVLSKERLVFKKFFMIMVVVTLWFKAGTIPFYLNVANLHLMNSRSGVLLVFAINTYNLLIMKTFFESVPRSLEEASIIDGANSFQIFYRIYLPLSKPALATVGMFYAVSRWNGYFWSMILLQDDSKIPLQVLLKKLIVDRVAGANEASLITADSLSSPLTVIYAVIIIAVLPMLIIYPYIQKFFKKGAMIGSIKG